MKNEERKTRFIIIFWIVAMVGIVLWSIRDVLFKPPNTAPRRIYKETIQDKNVSNEVLILLATKYKLSPEIVSNMLFDYCRGTGLECDSFWEKDIPEATTPVDKAIQDISSKYGMEPSQFVSLIIDERKLREVEDECIQPNNTDYDGDR